MITVIDFIWHSISALLVVLVSCLIGCIMLYVYPKYIIRIMQRYYRFKRGLTVRYVKINNSLTLSYMERGSITTCNSTLLMVHGFSGSKDGFTDMTKYLSSNIHIVALDLPGHGGSTRSEDIACDIPSFLQVIKKFVVVKGLDQRKFHIFGDSMGGMLSGLYAANYPDDLHSAILSCPYGIDSPTWSPLRMEYEKTKTNHLLPKSEQDFNNMMEMLCYKKLHIPKIVVQGIQQLRSQANWFYQKVADVLVDDRYKFLLEENLHRITIPLLLIWGRNDMILDVSSCDVIAKKLGKPPHKTIIIEECGHCIHIDHPRQMMKHVTEMIESYSN